MQVDCYFGTYARFDTASKKDAAGLLGADNLVGDVFDIVFQTETGASIAWLKNRFGGLIGFLDPTLSRELSVYAARGWTLRALLSFIAYSDNPASGHYWGQVALICYDPKFEQSFVLFVNSLAQKLSDGNRPDVELTPQNVSQLFSSEGKWMPTRTIPLPPKEKGTVIMKAHRKLSEKLIEQGRKGNKGCYVVNWVFLLALVALGLFGLKSCGVF